MAHTEQQILRDLTRLLPDAAATDVHDAWSIGEQECALDLLVRALAEQAVAVTQFERARIAALAEHWGTLEALLPQLRAIASADEEDAPWETVETTPRAALIESELGREIAAGHLLAEQVVIVWLAASCSDDLLVRVYRREPWGTGWPAHSYAIVYPTWSGAPEPPKWPTTEVFESVYDALEAFALRCET
jgi:hypothetical protein